MFRHRHPYGAGSASTIGMPRMVSMIGLLILLGMLVYRARDPAIWRWFTGEPNPGAEPAIVVNPIPADANPANAEKAETIVPGPRDDDPAEQAAIREKLDVVSDRAPLSREEMPAYWRLLDWSQSQGFDALAPRAKADVFYTQLWDQPDRYRGQLIRLRLHVMRALRHELPAEDGAPRHVYELWGWTDDSKSFPYVVVCSEVPAGFHVGANVREEVVFVGYFLKLLSYEAFDKSRASPLLLGRVRQFGDAVRPEVTQARNRNEFWVMLAVGGAIFAVIVRRWTRPKAKRATGPETLARGHFDAASLTAGAGSIAHDDDDAPAANGVGRFSFDDDHDS